MLLRNISISLMKDILYSASSWLSEFKTLIQMYLKFKLNFSKRFISKYITKIVRDSKSFVKYCDILIRGFEGNTILLVSIHSIFCFHILFIN